MPDFDKLLQAPLPEALEDAFQSLNGAYDAPEQLLQADVSALEILDCLAFAYFNRDEVFYVNAAARKLLHPKLPSMACPPPRVPPVFWLDDHEPFLLADQLVWANRRPLASAREIVTLSWGKTWMEGIKLPILSATGQPMAILFAGAELQPSQQIRRVAEQYQLSLSGFGDN